LKNRLTRRRGDAEYAEKNRNMDPKTVLTQSHEPTMKI
jgi:hypothetical protein